MWLVSNGPANCLQLLPPLLWLLLHLIMATTTTNCEQSMTYNVWWLDHTIFADNSKKQILALVPTWPGKNICLKPFITAEFGT